MMTSNFKIKAHKQLKFIQHWHPLNYILCYTVHNNHNITLSNNFNHFYMPHYYLIIYKYAASIIEIFHKSTGHTIISMPVESVTFANQ